MAVNASRSCRLPESGFRFHRDCAVLVTRPGSSPRTPVSPRTRASSPTSMFVAEACSSVACGVGRCEQCCAVRPFWMPQRPHVRLESRQSVPRGCGGRRGGETVAAQNCRSQRSSREVVHCAAHRPYSGEPEGTEVISWSPDGSRLLLMRSATFGPTAAIGAKSEQAGRAALPTLLVATSRGSPGHRTVASSHLIAGARRTASTSSLSLTPSARRRLSAGAGRRARARREPSGHLTARACSGCRAYIARVEHQAASTAST